MPQRQAVLIQLEPLESRRLLCAEPVHAAGGGAVARTSADHSTATKHLAKAMSPTRGVTSAAAATPLYPDLTPWISASRGYVHNWQIDKTTEPGRTLLRLSFASANIGNGPVELRGGPLNGDGTQQVFQRVFNSDGTWSDHLAGTFVYHPEHQHIHFEDFAEFRVRAIAPDGGVGAIVAGGEKTSFCLLDSVLRDGSLPGAPSSGQYVECNTIRQGISVGWADLYRKDLPDQDIDVTGLANGTYWLEVENDPLDRFLESDETNNVARIKIDLHLSDDSLPAAYDIGTLGPMQTYNEFVGAADVNDYYKFTLASSATVNLSLRDLYSNANLRLLNSGGGVIAQSINSGTSVDSLSSALAPGTYYVHVVRSLGDTTYTLQASTTSGPPVGVVNGTINPDGITLKRNPANADLLDVFFADASSARYSLNAVHLLEGSLTVNLQEGSDQLVIDFANGSPVPGGGIVVNGGAHSGGPGDLLALSGTAGDDLATFTTTHFDLSGTAIAYSDVEHFGFNGIGGSDELDVGSGTFRFTADAADATLSLSVNVAAGAAVIFDATQHLDALTIAGGAELTAGNEKVLVANTLAIAAGGQLDLHDNDMVLHDMPLGTSDGSVYSGVTGMIQSGLIVTSMPDATLGRTRLGVARAGDVLDIDAGETAPWDGQTVTADSILVKYTYAADANLDGLISGDDYTAIDFAVQVPAAFGYSNGDFNLDGIVSGDDYTIIDFLILAQGSPL